MSDSSYHYVICSHDGIDPEEARQIAESKCLASAAKLGGVTVKLTNKTVQSLTGSDSSEVAEIQPLQTNIKCEWTDRFLEAIKDGFRVWLKCKVLKSSIANQISGGLAHDTPTTVPVKHVEATLIVSTIPQADRIVIVGIGGERVIEPSSNIVSIKITNLDQRVEVNKLGYKKSVLELESINIQGQKISKSVILEKN